MVSKVFSCFYSTTNVQDKRPEFKVIPFDPAKHYESVRWTAWVNLEALATLGRRTTAEDTLKNEVMSVLSPERCRVLLAEQKPVGFVAFQAAQKRHWSGHMGSLDLLAVDASYRKYGGGRLLMEHALTELKEKNVEWVHVQTTSLASARFYWRFGFRPVMACPGRVYEMLAPVQKMPLHRLVLGYAHAFLKLNSLFVPPLLLGWVVLKG